MNIILLPIKPLYAEQILNGTKKIEFRKKIPIQHIDKVIIYESSPIKKVVGEFEVSEIVEDTPDVLFEKYSSVGGISKSDYDTYFKNNKKAYGYIIKSVKKYPFAENLIDYEINYIPQNYVYIEDRSQNKQYTISEIKNEYNQLLKVDYRNKTVILCGYTEGYNNNWAIVGFINSDTGCIKEFTDHVKFKKPDNCQSFRFVKIDKLRHINESNCLF